MFIKPISVLNNQTFGAKKNYFDKPMTEMTLADNIELNKVLFDQSAREREIFESRGIKDGRFTEEFIRTFHPNRFDEDGKLTTSGKDWIHKSLLAAKFKHPKLVTIEEFLIKYLKKVKLQDIFSR